MTRILVCLLSVAMLCSARAQLVSRDWRAAGDSLLTQDLNTGLQWLDLTETYDRTLPSIAPELAVGGRFQDFRIATRDEVWRLIEDAGLPAPDFHPSTNPYSPTQDPMLVLRAEAATALLGDTVGRYWAPDLLYGTRGYLWDGGAEALSGFWVQEHSFILYETNVAIPAIPGSGVWLVRAVPEPSSITGFGALALALLVAARVVSLRRHNTRVL